MTIDDRARRASVRARLFRLLAAGYYEPEKDFLLVERFAEQLADTIGELAPEQTNLATALAADLAAATQDELLLDYARLFVGPRTLLAYPYGSVHLDGEKRLMGESTQALRRLYAENGLDLTADFPEAPDHIAVELEFLYLLCDREATARRLADEQGLAAALAAQRVVFDQHLGRWVGAFAGAVKSGAQTSYYRTLAGLTEFAVRQAGADR